MLFHENLLFVLLLSWKLNKCWSDDKIGCGSFNKNKLQEAVNRKPLDLNFSGDIRTFPDVKIVSITPKNTQYINARLEKVDDRIDLIIFTTEHFQKYIYEQTSPNITFYAKFECEDGRTRDLIFTQPLKEENYCAPKFTKELYTFIIPTPLYKGFDLSAFEEISAIDYDLTGNSIQFSSTDLRGFQISVGTRKHDGKTSFASLRLLSILLSLKEKLEFSIIATDTGNNPRSSLSKVVITANISNSLPPIPRFLKTVVYGNLTKSFKLSKLEIVLDPKTYSTDIRFRKLFDNEDIFKIEKNNNIVYVSLSKELDVQFLTGKERISFDIEATNIRLAESTRTAVSISLPQKKGLYFKKELYEGKLYVKSNTLEIENIEVILDEIQLQYIVFDLKGTKKHLFNIIPKQNVVSLSPSPNPGADTWSDITHFSLTLVANVNAYENGSTNIIIDVIHPILSFQKMAYTGIIDSKGDLQLDSIVLLTRNDSTDGVVIQLLETDAHLFSYKKIGNEIEIKLREKFREKDLQSKYLKLEVEAKETSTGVRANCLIFIDKPRKISVMKFIKNIYEAHIGPEVELKANNIVLDEACYNDQIEFSLLGRDARYFSFQQSRNILTLSLNVHFKLNKYSHLNTLWIELKALDRKEQTETSTIVIVDVIRELVPEFEATYYIGELTRENVLKLEKLVISMSTWRTYTTININGTYSSLFDYTVSDNNVQISLKSEPTEEVLAYNSIVLVATASNNDKKGYSTIVINLPKTHNLSNIFKQQILKGRILEDQDIQEIKIGDIELVKDYDVADLACKLSGDESKYFDYTLIAPKNVIKLILAAEVAKEVMQTNFYITILLECHFKEDASISGSTAIFLGLPGSMVSNGCPSPEPPTYIPEFQSAFYKLDAEPNYVGPLISVHAIIRGSDNAVRYSLHDIDEHLRSRINIDPISGQIFLHSITSPGRYFFNIVAENVVTHGETQAKARLNIQALVQCKDHACVSNSLLIKYLEEEVVHNSILNAKFDNCEFHIFSMEPNDREYVKIDPATKMLTMIPTDREDSVFDNMILPQIEVKLKLDCVNKNNIVVDNSNNRWRSVRDLRSSEGFIENRSMILTEDIIFAKDVTVLSIILVDINDNRPKFVKPIQDHFVVGFPDEDSSMQIFSENLFQVDARDNDIGLNAEIHYSIQPNKHFQIHPKSGIVYPCATAMQEISKIELFVYATDRGGSRDSLRSKFTLVVQVLKREHFTLLTFVNENPESIDTLIEGVRNRTGLYIIAVKHAILPSGKKKFTADIRMLPAGPLQYIQKIWTYAFDGEFPVSSWDMKQKLAETCIDDGNISAATFEEVLHFEAGGELMCKQDLTSYIAGLCVLSVSILACIGFIIWRYIHKDYAHCEPTNDISTAGPINQNFNLKKTAEVDIRKQTHILDEALSEPSLYSKRESVGIWGTTTKESTDGKRFQVAKLNSFLNGALNEENNGNETDSSSDIRMPRPTVTFNEFVERIHIETDKEHNNKS